MTTINNEYDNNVGDIMLKAINESTQNKHVHKTVRQIPNTTHHSRNESIDVFYMCGIERL